MMFSTSFLDFCQAKHHEYGAEDCEVDIAANALNCANNFVGSAVCGEALAHGCIGHYVDIIPAKSSGVKPADLRSAMAAAARSVQPWTSGSFSLVEKLQDARGNFGHVDLMRSSVHGGREVAVKQMPNGWVCANAEEFEYMNPDAAERPWLDLCLLKTLHRMQYPYACELLGIFRDEESTYVVTSLATKGDLFSWSMDCPAPGAKREALMKPIFRQVFHAVQMLHEIGVAHRDLSLENILLTEDESGFTQVKIIDFAMSTVSSRCRGEARGKVIYRAPEMHGASAYDPFLADAFALGVVLFAAAARDYPWSSTRKSCKSFNYVCEHGLRKLLEQRKLRNGSDARLLQVLSTSLVELLEGLLALRPDRRLGLGALRLGEDQGRSSVWDTTWIVAERPV